MLGLLATTLAASAALLIPGQSREALGIELMLIALIYISLSTLATFRATRSPRGVSRDRLVRFLLGELSAGLIFAGGLGLLVHALGGAYLVAAGVVLGVLSAMLALDPLRRPRVRAAARLKAARGRRVPTRPALGSGLATAPRRRARPPRARLHRPFHVKKGTVRSRHGREAAGLRTGTGATGLEPATSGVTGGSWRFRPERGHAGIPRASEAF